MFMTRKADYAIRSVLFLTLRQEQLVTIDEIAKAMHIPKTFLSKILQQLIKTNIVESVRGIKGGVLLSKDPEGINLMEVIEIVQGPLALNVCVVDKKYCDLSNTCVVHPVWIHLREIVEEELRKRNFKQLAEQHRK